MLPILISNAAFAEPGAVVSAGETPDSRTSRLPNVLIIGDSISLGYTDDVRSLLAGKANVYRSEGNSGPTSSGIEHIDEWLAADPALWDVIHFNFGLHDIKLAPTAADAPYPGGHQVPPEMYEQNLRFLVGRMKTVGAKLIFGTTTPVPAGNLDPPRTRGDEEAYNAIALNVMRANEVAIDDLYHVAMSVIDRIQMPQNVHFTPDGYRTLAEAVASSIASAMGG